MTTITASPVPSTGADLADIPRVAKELLADGQDWCQGALYLRSSDRHGPIEARCLVGALWTAATGQEPCPDQFLQSGPLTTLFSQVYEVVAEIVEEQYGGVPSLGYWNDAPGRTWDEVAAVLDKAAIRLEEQG